MTKLLNMMSQAVKVPAQKAEGGAAFAVFLGAKGSWAEEMPDGSGVSVYKSYDSYTNYDKNNFVTLRGFGGRGDRLREIGLNWTKSG